MTDAEYEQIRHLQLKCIEHSRTCNCWRARFLRFATPIMTWMTNRLMRLANRRPLAYDPTKT